MSFEALDITIESRGPAIWIFLSGPFYKDQIQPIRSKIESFIRDGHRELIIDLENITSIHHDVAPMFLALLNMIKGKDGIIRLIYKNKPVSKAFYAYRNIFSIYPDSKSINAKKVFHTFRKGGIFIRRRTGIRVSVPVAIFLLFIVTALFLSLGVIIDMQRNQIAVQENEIRNFQQWKHKTNIELQELQSRIKPMKQLGLLIDSLSD